MQIDSRQRLHKGVSGEVQPSLVITGIPDDHSGTGQFVGHLLEDLRVRGRWDVRIVCSPQGQSVSEKLTEFAKTASDLLVIHPQSIGMRSVIEIMQARANDKRLTNLFMLDNSFFCVRSYNYRRGLATPCLECVGTSGEPARRLSCRPFPVADPSAGSYVAMLKQLVKTSSVRLFAQSEAQAELARRHFGQEIGVSVVGLWCRDWDSVFTNFSSTQGFVPDPSYDVVFHGPLLGSKGVEWTWNVAALCPEWTFLLPFAPGTVRTALPENVLLREMSWDTGLKQAVRTARMTLVPSLWSAATEGALIKSIVDAPAVGVVDIQSAYSNQLPAGLIARLPIEPVPAAAMLRDLLTSSWRPDWHLWKRWVGEFATFNRYVIERLFPGASLGDFQADGLTLEFDFGRPSRNP